MQLQLLFTNTIDHPLQNFKHVKNIENSEILIKNAHSATLFPQYTALIQTFLQQNAFEVEKKSK